MALMLRATKDFTAALETFYLNSNVLRENAHYVISGNKLSGDISVSNCFDCSSNRECPYHLPPFLASVA